LPAPARSDQQVEQVGPVGIGSFDLVELPCAAPSLDALFVRDGFFDRVAALGPDEALELVAGAEIRALARAMLVDPGGQVGRDTAYIAPGSDRPCARAKLGAPNLRAMRTSELAGASGRFPPTADPTPPRKKPFPYARPICFIVPDDPHADLTLTLPRRCAARAPPSPLGRGKSAAGAKGEGDLRSRKATLRCGKGGGAVASGGRALKRR